MKGWSGRRVGGSEMGDEERERKLGKVERGSWT